MANETHVVAGTLHSKTAEQVKSDKLTLIDFIINTGGEHPQYIKIQANNARMELLNNINVGDPISARVNVKGRLWNDTSFNSLELWKLE